jgi:hypothetical protein
MGILGVRSEREYQRGGYLFLDVKWNTYFEQTSKVKSSEYSYLAAGLVVVGCCRSLIVAVEHSHPHRYGT